MSKRGRIYANISEPPAKVGSVPGPGRRQVREEEDGGGERWQRVTDRRKPAFYPTATGLSSSSNDATAAAAAGGGRRGGGSGGSGGGKGAGVSRSARNAAAAAAGVGSRYAGALAGKFAGELNADALYRDETDRQTLENMNEFEREAELARRYEELVRERQRAELLRRQDRGAAEERSSGRLGEALSDIRARRARQKQLQQRQTSDEEEEEEEGAEEDFLSSTHAPAAATAADEESEEMSVSLSSSEEEGEAVSTRVSVDESARLPASVSTPGASEAVDVKAADAAAAAVAVEEGASATAADVTGVAAAEDAAAADSAGEALDAAADHRQLGGAAAATAATQPLVLPDEALPVLQREEEVCGDDLFEEDRIDTDEQRKKEVARRMLQRVSLDLLNAARLSIERLTLMLEHPQAEKFVCGCYVKVPQQQPRGVAVAGNNSNNALLLAAAAANTPCWVCQIVGLKPCDPYPVRLPTAAAAANCCYRLVLRLAPKAPARFDREFALTDLVSAPVTPSEFEDWKKKLEEFDTVEDVSKRIRMKLQMLKEFTFTDEDVQTILSRKREGSAATVVQTSGSLLKQLMFVKHQLDTLHYSLSSAATAASSRKDLKEKLQVLQEKKADLEARLARSKAATGGQRDLLHRLSVEARLARRREHAAPLLLTRSSHHRRPSSSSGSAGAVHQRVLQQQWQQPSDSSLQASAAAAGGRAGDSSKTTAVGSVPSFLGGRTCAASSRAAAVTTAGAHTSNSIRPDGRPAFARESERNGRRSPLQQPTPATSATLCAAAAAARNSSSIRSSPAGVSRPTEPTGAATGLRALQHESLLLPGGEDESAAATGFAEEVLLQGTRQQQREWMQLILQNQRAAGKFKIEKSIPPPAPYTSIVSLLPYSPPPAGRGLLISLEEYKQQVAQLANLQLAG